MDATGEPEKPAADRKVFTLRAAVVHLEGHLVAVHLHSHDAAVVGKCSRGRHAEHAPPAQLASDGSLTSSPTGSDHDHVTAIGLIDIFDSTNHEAASIGFAGGR